MVSDLCLPCHLHLLQLLRAPPNSPSPTTPLPFSSIINNLPAARDKEKHPGDPTLGLLRFHHDCEAEGNTHNTELYEFGTQEREKIQN